MKIIVLTKIPRFVWKDMNEYGGYKFGERIELADEIARVLIQKGLAQAIT